MKTLRVSISASVLAMLLLLFFFLPVPVSRVRQTGLVQIEPEAIIPVHVEVPGRLEKILVRNGQHVKKGATLAVFSNIKMKQEEGELRALHEKKQEIAMYSKHHAKESAELERSLPALESERDSTRKLWLTFQKMNMDRLIVRAPRDGIVMGLPKVEEIGKSWEAGHRFLSESDSQKSAMASETPEQGETFTPADQDRPFCYIGEPTKLRVLVPISPVDYDLVRADLKRFEAQGRDLEVTIRVHGRDSHTWKGKINLMPASEAKSIPIQLSNKGGGPLAIKTNSPRDFYIPQNQVYLVGIRIDEADDAIAPGSLAQVKIHCQYRTCAWWVWRWISSTLDLRLSI